MLPYTTFASVVDMVLLYGFILLYVWVDNTLMFSAPPFYLRSARSTLSALRARLAPTHTHMSLTLTVCSFSTNQWQLSMSEHNSSAELRLAQGTRRVGKNKSHTDALTLGVGHGTTLNCVHVVAPRLSALCACDRFCCLLLVPYY